MRKYLILHKPLSTSLYLEKVTVSSAIKGVHMKLDVIIPEKGAWLWVKPTIPHHCEKNWQIGFSLQMTTASIILQFSGNIL